MRPTACCMPFIRKGSDRLSNVSYKKCVNFSSVEIPRRIIIRAVPSGILFKLKKSGTATFSSDDAPRNTQRGFIFSGVIIYPQIHLFSLFYHFLFSFSILYYHYHYQKRDSHRIVLKIKNCR